MTAPAAPDVLRTPTMEPDGGSAQAPAARVALAPDDAHNRTLVEHVHPAAWQNPRPRARYNLVVIGGGTAGLVAAIGSAGLGARVALIERHLLGGDCLNTGCVPSKALIRSARAVFDARGLNGPAFHAEGTRPGAPSAAHFAAAMERMRRLRADIAEHDAARRVFDSGVDVFFGDASFVSRDEVTVAGQRLRFARAVIATGGRSKAPAVPGLAEAGFLTSETVFSLTTLPLRLLVLGGGPIGCELAQAFRRFGSAVTLVTTDDRLLPRDDADAAAALQAQLVEEGVELVFGAELLSVARTAAGKEVRFRHAGTPGRDGGDATIVVDEILAAIGRTPNVRGLGLEVAGVAFDEKGVTVDDHLRTTNAHIFAAGDVCSPYKFTHAADAMARVVIQNALFSFMGIGRKRASSLVIPWSTYTDPEIAAVGISAEDAVARGAAVQTFTTALIDNDRAILDGETRGFARLRVDARSGRILGATVVARHAGEMIGEVALAMTAGLSVTSLAQTIHPYPTQAEVWKRLGDAHARTRLKPWMKGWFERILRWRR